MLGVPGNGITVPAYRRVSVCIREQTRPGSGSRLAAMDRTDRILVVDDDPELRKLLSEYLTDVGFAVDLAGDGEQMRRALAHAMPDAIVMDLMLPGTDGLSLTREVRAKSSVPILMLSARGEEIDRVVGLEVGADDYLTKPFSMRELMARVKAQLRRTRLLQEEMAKSGANQVKQEKLSFGDLVVNLTRREVTLQGEPIQLKPQEYELLVFFAEHKGQMLSREFILERVWGWDFIGDSRTVDVHVRWLRQKVEKDPANPKRLITVRGGGYRFEG